MTGRLMQLSGAIVDLVYSVQAVPKPGEEAIVSDFAVTPGGGYNAMVAARRAGMEVTYAGGIGSGPFGQIIQNALNAEDIQSLLPPDPNRDQGCCTVMIDRAGERTFVAREGAEGHVTADHLAEVDCTAHDWVLLSGYALYYDGSRGAFRDWLRSDAAIPNLVFDPAPVVAQIQPDVLNAALERALWLSLNAREARVLTGLSDPIEAATALATTRPENGGVVLRNGAAGCIVATARACTFVPGHTVSAIDTNGAGDTHLGSFFARLSMGDTPATAAVYANVAAALSTTRKGPATAPTAAQVLQITNNKTACLTSTVPQDTQHGDLS